MTLSREELLHWVENHVALGDGIDILKNDCEIIEFMLDHCEIEIPAHNRFFVKVNCTGISDVVMEKRKSLFYNLPETIGLRDGAAALAYTGYCDF